MLLSKACFLGWENLDKECKGTILPAAMGAVFEI